ncbi:hypothetical protein BKI52_28220 [marine bacterium AO1-C]|nr:hypothetical protein BKI52_28220 [marine bacterium AO1-C]
MLPSFQKTDANPISFLQAIGEILGIQNEQTVNCIETINSVGIDAYQVFTFMEDNLKKGIDIPHHSLKTFKDLLEDLISSIKYNQAYNYTFTLDGFYYGQQVTLLGRFCNNEWHYVINEVM